jgi:hypothetical protein
MFILILKVYRIPRILISVKNSQNGRLLKLVIFAGEASKGTLVLLSIMTTFKTFKTSKTVNHTPKTSKQARECLSRLAMPPRLIVVGHINFALSVRLSVRPGLSG